MKWTAKHELNFKRTFGFKIQAQIQIQLDIIVRLKVFFKVSQLHRLREQGKAVTLLICILEILCSIFGRDTSPPY
jgi:hypothetical protein